MGRVDGIREDPFWCQARLTSCIRRRCKLRRPHTADHTPEEAQIWSVAVDRRLSSGRIIRNRMYMDYLGERRSWYGRSNTTLPSYIYRSVARDTIRMGPCRRLDSPQASRRHSCIRTRPMNPLRSRTRDRHRQELRQAPSNLIDQEAFGARPLTDGVVLPEQNEELFSLAVSSKDLIGDV